VSPVCICASPLKLVSERSIPSCLKMPACTPTSAAENAQELGTDLPRRSLSCASAGALINETDSTATADHFLGMASIIPPGDVLRAAKRARVFVSLNFARL